MLNNILELIRERDGLTETIQKELDISTYLPIELNESFWKIDGLTVYFGETPDNVDTFANEITNTGAIVYKDTVTAMLVMSYDGDSFWQVFINSKKVED